MNDNQQSRTTKVVINACHGGFSLSEEGARLYAQKKGLPFFVWKDPRYSSDLFKTYFTADPSAMTNISNEFYKAHHLSLNDIDRTDTVLVEVVEELGEKAWGQYAKLKIVELPSGTLYRITEYDGLESIETSSEIDWRVA